MSIVHIIADGTGRLFEFPFAVFSADELEVRVDDIIATEGFTVVGAGASTGGHVRFVYPPLAGTQVTLRRLGKVEVSDLDHPGFLEDKLVAGANVTITKHTAPDGQNLEISADFSSDEYARKDQNLADLPDAAAARANLGLGSAALLNAGTGPGEVATTDQMQSLIGASPATCAAWVVFDATGGVVNILSSHNIAGIARNNAGDFTVSFITPFASNYYAVNGMVQFSDDEPTPPLWGGTVEIYPNPSAMSAGACRVIVTSIRSWHNARDTKRVCLSFFGYQ